MSPNRDKCDDCDPGQYLNRTISQCELCTSGRFAPTAVSDQCLECAAGSATGMPVMGQTLCSKCSSGLYSEGLAVNCSICPTGTYSGV